MLGMYQVRQLITAVVIATTLPALPGSVAYAEGPQAPPAQRLLKLLSGMARSTWQTARRSEKRLRNHRCATLPIASASISTGSKPRSRRWLPRMWREPRTPRGRSTIASPEKNSWVAARSARSRARS